MRILITGGAGFVGSNLAERLVYEGHAITVVDNLSAGKVEFLAPLRSNAAFRFVKADLLDLEPLTDIVAGCDAVFHLAANSDISQGRKHSDTDLRLGTIATYNVLEAMRRTGVDKFLFSSSSVVYGEPSVVPTPEDYGPLLPISLYGASKLACEGLVSAFCHNYGFQAWIFRFANICGRHGTHGAIVDFVTKLQVDPSRLEVLGNGFQSKPYLHVGECVDGMLYIWRHSSNALNIFNLGRSGATDTRTIARAVIEAMELRGVELSFTGGNRGWPGDVPRVQLDCSRLTALGWTAPLSSSDAAVYQAAAEIVEEISCKSLS